MTRKRGAGFTIVELMVVIVVLVILTTIATVRLRLTQQGGRDQERKIDTQAIAAGLEVYYENGNVTTYTPKGYYPGGAQVEAARGLTPPFNEFLEGVAAVSYQAPGREVADSFGVDPGYATSAVGANADGSYSNAQAKILLATRPYLYQPLRRNNAFCVSYIDCVKFNLYYQLEAPTADCPAPDNICIIRSKNQ